MSAQSHRPRLTFRQAARTDTARAQDAYQRIIGHLAATVDFPHWHSENHPTPAEVAAWVDAGELYLALEAERDTVAGVMVLNHDAPEAYGDAAWAVAARSDEVLVVHALGVTPEFLRQGVARFLVDAALDVARAQSCRAVRLDTFVDNLPARELYARYGFTDLGLHALHYDGTALTDFHLFEYVL